MNIQVDGTFISLDENRGKEIFVEIIDNSFELLAASFLTFPIILIIGIWGDNFTRFASNVAFDEDGIKSTSDAQDCY